MGKRKRKRRRPIKPKRGYDQLGAAFIGAIAVFIATNMIIVGQFFYGEPDGVLITEESHPIMFWAGVSFPVAVGVLMVVMFVRTEIHYRSQLADYSQQLEEFEESQRQDG